MHKPNLVHVAIEAAGGRETLAPILQVHVNTISTWRAKREFPSCHIVKICSLGEYIIKPEQLLAYIDWARREVKNG